MSNLRAKAGLVLGSGAALAAGVVGARAYFDESAVTVGTAGGGTAVYECPMAGALSIGEVREGDKVWLIGVTGDRWAVIRHPLQPDRPAWMPLALVDTAADAGDLPELGCADAVDLAGGAPTESTAPTPEGGSTTTIGATVPLDSTTTSSSSTTTTIVGDTTGPTVQITLDAEVLNVCATLTASVVIDDPTLPMSIISVRATWTAGGVEREEGFTRLNVSGNKYALSISKAESGLSSGSVPLTVIVLARDGLNNRTEQPKQIVLSSVGC